ncbi:MAG: hypothetical protein WCI02_18070 [Planctomycetota bacterium]
MVRFGRFTLLKTLVSLGVGAVILGGLMLDVRAQEPEQPTIHKAMRSSQLPGDWIGTWRGTVRNFRPDGEPNAFEMELTIAPTGSSNELQWKIVYEGPQGKSERDYRIYSGESEGRFVIDEQNGIRIDAVLFENTLLSHFSNQSQTLWTKYERSASSEPPEIRFELVAADNQNKTVTKAKGLDIAVESVQASSHQTAILKRVESPTRESRSAGIPAWRKLETDAYRGKQDDIYFVDENIGWYVNGEGKIYKSVDGGENWTLQWHHPGAYFRCIAFLDQQHGFAGNIGPGYFPNVSDPIPLYETKDGGSNWTPVETIEGAPVVGLCALQVLREPYVNAGQLETRTRLLGVGRVGGPAAMIVSDDMGASWQQLDIASHAAMAFRRSLLESQRGIDCSSKPRRCIAVPCSHSRNFGWGKNLARIMAIQSPVRAHLENLFPNARHRICDDSVVRSRSRSEGKICSENDGRWIDMDGNTIER